MRRSKINLIINREDYQKYENYFFYIRLFLIGLTTVFLIVFFIFVSIIKNKNDLNNKLNNQKKSFLQAIASKKGDEAKVYYVQKKYNDLMKFYKEDAFSSPYYRLLTSALKESSEEATLKSFEIGKNREVSFSISFENFSKMMSFFKFTESETFLKNFELISLKTFTVFGGDKEKKENYELSFAGRFIYLKPEF